MEESYCIDSIERTCIACPASWKGETKEGKNVYVRFRGGIFRINIDYKDIPDTTVYRESIGDEFDGYMDGREMREKLRMIGIQVEDEISPQFYGIPTEECRLELTGDWFDKMYCDSCQWRVQLSDVEKVEFETVIPEYCPKCRSGITVETSEPERLSELRE